MYSYSSYHFGTAVMYSQAGIRAFKAYYYQIRLSPGLISEVCKIFKQCHTLSKRSALPFQLGCKYISPLLHSQQLLLLIPTAQFHLPVSQVLQQHCSSPLRISERSALIVAAAWRRVSSSYPACATCARTWLFADTGPQPGFYWWGGGKMGQCYIYP